MTARRWTRSCQWLRGDGLRAVNDCAEMISELSLTARSHIWPRGVILVSLVKVWEVLKRYPEKKNYIGQYVNTGLTKQKFKIWKFNNKKMTQSCQWLRGVNYNFEYLGEYESIWKIVLVWKLGTHMELIHEKKRGSKISWHCPFNRLIDC